jgi:type VI secretion system protein ImpK
MSDDPFSDLPDSDRTIIRPSPGGRVPSTPQAARRPPAETLRGLDDTLPLIGINPLVAAASPLLAAAIRLRGRLQLPDPDALRRSIADAVRDFEQRALATGLDTRSLRAARYALCATIDDLVLSTPWGSHSAWTAQSLTSMFHNEVSGGERFFDILDQMQRELGKHGEVVELMYLCLSLGFEGRYRILPRGAAALGELRESLFRTLRQRRPAYEPALSPHWQGAGARFRPLKAGIPLWVLASATAFLAAMIYLAFNLLLGGISDETYARLAGLPPNGPLMIMRQVATPPPPPPPPPPVVENSLASRLHTFLAPEIREGLVTVLEDGQTVTIRIANRNMFGSGEATLNPSYGPLIDRIAKALQDEPGKILVVGHTDNQPIRTVRFPSNFQLSQARADSVGRLISAKLSDPARLHAEGRADSEPIASNATADGRQQNRRTDIVLIKPAPPL